MKDIFFCILLSALIVLFSIFGAKVLDWGKKFPESRKSPLTWAADRVE